LVQTGNKYRKFTGRPKYVLILVASGSGILQKELIVALPLLADTYAGQHKKYRHQLDATITVY